MPRSQFVAVGSNTNIKSGTGTFYGAVVGGANGASFYALDSVSIGNAPNYATLGQSVPSNLAYVAGISAVPFQLDMHGVPFQVGLTVAATSNAPMTIFYD